MKPLCIYHANCNDGFAAAFAVWLKNKDYCEYKPMHYSDGLDLETCRDRAIYIVDFSFKRPVMEQLIQTAEFITVLDHHESAEKELQGLQDPDQCKIIFDMTQSGCMLAWKYFHPGGEVPPLFQYIQDWDLWKFEFGDTTRDFIAGLRSYPFSFEKWEWYLQEWNNWEDKLLSRGEAINDYRRENIDKIKSNAWTARIGDYEVPCVNCPGDLTSVVLGELSEGKPFAIGYTDIKDQRIWSLRSCDSGMNVAEIAEKFGGGGHAHAAGFTTDIPWETLYSKDEPV